LKQYVRKGFVIIKLVSDVELSDINQSIRLLENLQETKFYESKLYQVNEMLEALLELKKAVKELSYDVDIEDSEALQAILYDED
tara:strand:+ start:44 stop:295 length:252 start_codon:yes stop_codon:yes gene_type:complete